ncbi:phosphatidylinositol alpha-1,6-mannosyltransferase [Rhizobiales bacterium GAS191]|nr:phosphatidylinositol alpha-1,6-mannosyltransferase [Rhizobiales bacterium GAS191]
MQKKARLAIAAENLSAGHGGISRLARLMAKSIVRNQYPVKAVSLSDRVPPADFGFPIKACATSRLSFLINCSLAAFQSDRFLFDFAGMARVHQYLLGPRRPFAVWMAGIEVWEDLRPDRRRSLDAASLRLVISSYTRDRALRVHGRYGDAKVCWLATETDDVPGTRLKHRSGPPTVLIIARMDQADKGHRALIGAWPEVVAAIPDACLLLVGGGSHFEQIRDLARQSSVASRIDLPGFVPEERMPEFWQRAHIYAMPSRVDGFGIVYIEAMRYGLPVIASREDAGQEINLDGVTGYNVHRDRPGELAAGIIELLRNQGLAAQFGRQAIQRWRDHFTFSRFHERFSTILNDWTGEPTQ